MTKSRTTPPPPASDAEHRAYTRAHAASLKEHAAEQRRQARKDKNS